VLRQRAIGRRDVLARARGGGDPATGVEVGAAVSPGRVDTVYLVAITRRSRRLSANVPTRRSALPLVYWLAVPTKLPPRST
jgi:hypothetical protein